MDDEKAGPDETARRGADGSEDAPRRDEPAAEAGPGEPGPAGRDGGEEREEAGPGGRSGHRGGGSVWSDTLSDVQEVVGDILQGVRGIPSVGRFPRYDLVQLGEEGYRVLMDLPGIERSDVEIRTVGDELTIAGKRTRPEAPEGAETLHSERGFGRFRRTLRIPADVAREEIGAQLEDGVLTIRLPREARAEAHTVEIE